MPFRFLRWIVLGEVDLHVAAVAGLRADELFLEAGDQLARAQLDLHVGTGAAVERLSTDAAHEIHHDEVASGGRMALLGVRPALVGAGEPLKLLFDGGFVEPRP